jgi:hypothetical protein
MGKKKVKSEDKNKALKERFLQYFRDLPVQKLAGEYIGKSEDAIIDWKKADPDFANQIMLAKAEWAMAKSKGVKSKEWLLERLMKDHFAPRQELTGKEGKDLPAPILGGIAHDVPTDDSNKENS